MVLAAPARVAAAPEGPVWWRELLIIVAFLVPYDLIRMAASDHRGPALAHAADILALERYVGLDVEAGLNAAVAGARWAEVTTAFWYAGLHYLVTPLVLLALFRYRPELYRRARLALMAATATALIGYLAYPTAPPRMLPGYVDTLIATADVGWWPQHDSGGLNQLAAMPSMHVGWALWCGLALAALARHRWQRALAFTYPVVTTVVVVATANHWLLDAIAGALLVAAAWAALTVRATR